jgi:hypothetical protein
MPKFKDEKFNPSDLGGKDPYTEVLIPLTGWKARWNEIQYALRLKQRPAPIDLSPGEKDLVELARDREAKLDKAADDAIARACGETENQRKQRS